MQPEVEISTEAGWEREREEKLMIIIIAPNTWTNDTLWTILHKSEIIYNTGCVVKLSDKFRNTSYLYISTY